LIDKAKENEELRVEVLSLGEAKSLSSEHENVPLACVGEGESGKLHNFLFFHFIQEFCGSINTIFFSHSSKVKYLNYALKLNVFVFIFSLFFFSRKTFLSISFSFAVVVP